MAHKVLVALTLACTAVCAGAAPAMADACGPLKTLMSVDLTPMPGGLRLLVPVVINNVPQKMLLSTAGGFTTITAAAAKALNLHPIDDSGHVRLLDSAGNASRQYVHIDTLQLGQLQAQGMDVLLTPNRDAGQNGVFDGSLAGDLMSHYDVEIDFAARKLLYFSADHCDGHVLYWPASASAVVPFVMMHPDNSTLGQRPRVSRYVDTHIRVPVTLDGKNLTAIVDTAAANSSMSAQVAKFVFGVTADSPGSVPLGMVGGDPDHKVFGHVFSSLAFDGITVKNAHIAIIPDLLGSKDPDNRITTSSRTQHVDDGLGPEVTIGMDVLKNLHLYIAYHEEKLYITPASNAAAPPAAANVSADAH